MRRISLKAYLMMISLVITISMLCILGGTAYSGIIREVSELEQLSQTMEIGTINNSINEKMDSTIKICASLQQSSRFYEYARSAVKDSLPMSERIIALNKLRNMLNIICMDNSHIASIIVRIENKFITVGKLEKFVDFDFGESLDEKITMYYPREYALDTLSKFTEQSLDKYMYYGFLIRGEPDCEVYFVLSDKLIEDVEKLSSQYQIFNENGNLFFDSNGNAWKEDNKLSQVQISDENWRVEYVHEMTEYYDDYHYVFWVFVGAILVAIGLCVTLSHISADRIVASLNGLFQSLESHDFKRKKHKEVPTKAYGADIRNALFVFLFTTTLLPLVMFALVFSCTVSGIMNRQYLESNVAIVKNIGDSFEQKFHRAKNVLARVILDSELFVESEEGGEINDVRLHEVLQENVLYGLYDVILEIYDKDGQLLYSNNLLSESKLENATTGLFEWSLEKNIMNQEVLVLSTRIINKSMGGSARILLSVEELNNQLFKMTNRENKVGLLWEVGDESWRNYKSGETYWSVEQNGNTNVVAKLGDIPGYIQLQYKSITSFEVFLDILRSNAPLFILFLLVLNVLNIMALRIILPAKRIQKSMESLTPGNVDRRLSGSLIDEVNDVINKYNEMADRIDSLIDNLAIVNNIRIQNEKNKREAEIAALQMQINPHFLSNTIETIRVIIREGRSEDACEMLCNLNNIFRYAIGRKDITISIEEEIKYTRSYLQLMQIRYDYIDFQWEIDEDILQLQIIRMVLQPIVENAIYHGIMPAKQKNKISRGIIRITCVRNGDDVLFRVQDNGDGMELVMLEEVRRQLVDEKNEVKIGLYNVQSRLRLFYGTEYGLDLISLADQGLEVVLRLRAIETENNLKIIR